MKKVLRKVVTVAMLVTMFSTAVNLCTVSADPFTPQQKVTSQYKIPSKPVVKPPIPSKIVPPAPTTPRITTSPTLPCITTSPTLPRITTPPTLSCNTMPPTPGCITTPPTPVCVTPPAIKNLCISVGSTSATPNENIAIPVSFENIRDEIFICNFDITYDPTQLKYISYDPQSIVPDATDNFEISKPTDGTLKVLFFDYKKLEQSIKYDGTIAYLTFEVIGTSNVETSLSISNVTVANRDLNELTPDIKSGKVRIEGSPTPTIVSPTPGSFEITIGSEKASTNDIISLPVYFDDIPERGITTVDLNISYDTKQLKYISCDSGSIVRNPDVNFVSNESVPGKIKIVFLDYTLENEYINSNGIFAMLNFEVIGNPFDVAHIKVGNVTIGDRDLYYVETTSYPGAVIIESSQTPISDDNSQTPTSDFYCKIGSTKASAGDVITIPVNFENVSVDGIAACNMTITYDPEELEYDDYNAGSIVENPDVNLAINNPSPGIIKVVFLDYTMEDEPINSSGVFTNLIFKVLDTNDKSTEVNIVDSAFVNYDLNYIDSKVENGTISLIP
jgi:hypothetical protein